MDAMGPPADGRHPAEAVTGALGSSFIFEVPPAGDTWSRVPERSAHNPDRWDERTNREVRVVEFGPTPFPVYAIATAGVATGEHPPRSVSPARTFKDDAEWQAYLKRLLGVRAHTATRRE
jgi:hypothetical protein